MNMIKRLMALLLAVLMCGTIAFGETSADDVMVTVGTTPVTRSTYEGHLNTLVNYYANYGYDTTDPSMLALLQQFALQTSVEYAAMDQMVIDLGLSLTEAEIAAATANAQNDWAAVIADGLSYYGITEASTEEEIAQTLLAILAELESRGYTEESYLAESLMYAGYDKLFAYLTQDVEVSDDEVLAYYNSLVEADKAIYENDAAAYEEVQYYNQFYAAYGYTEYITNVYYKPAGYRLVTHILLEADEALLTAYSDLQAQYEEQQLTLEEGGEVTATLITEADLENARLAVLANVQPKVDEINQKMAEGKTFAELIPEYTTDPGMSDAASIAAGYEVHMDSVNWVIPFRDQSFTVNNIGDVTAPVVTDYGVHIIQYVADVPGGAVELTDAMFNEFKTALQSNAAEEVYYAGLDAWIAAADVVYSDEAKAIMNAAE